MLSADKAFPAQVKAMGAPQPAQMKRIQDFARRDLKLDEVFVFEVELANSRVDRAYERFTEEVLGHFARTLPGKSLVAGHDYRALPIGKWFHAEVRDSDYSGQDAIGQSGSAKALMAQAYIMRNGKNADLIAEIEGGVLDYVSIGFQFSELTCDICNRSLFGSECPHIPGTAYEVGEAA